MWRICLFGGLTVEHGTVRLTRFETRKVDALLAYLALHHPNGLPREVVGEMLWPDEDWTAVRSRMRQALSSLRQELLAQGAPGGLLIAERDSVRLDPDRVSIDTFEFGAALAQARCTEAPEQRLQWLEHAVRLYRGPLLPGWYDDETARERDRLAQAWGDAAVRLGVAFEKAGDIDGAIELARRLLDEDPLREDAVILLMRCYAAAGRPSDAVRQFRALERALREELGAEPSADARRICALAKEGHLRGAPALAASPTHRSRPAGGRCWEPSHPRAACEPDGGAVPLDSDFYIERPVDHEFAVAVARQDSIVLVKGARCIGKTSLLARGLQQARASGARVVLTDLQKLTVDRLQTADTVLLTLARMLADELGIEPPTDEQWNPQFGWNVNFERFVRRVVLAQSDAPLIWGLDEVDRLFAYPFSTEVFGLFRSWHNERSLNPDGPWRRLTIAIAYATEAHLFIDNLNQSPFNVGTRLLLDDFTCAQVEALNARYGRPLKSAADTDRLYGLLNGHPYLTRRALSAMKSQNGDIATIDADSCRDDGPFGDTLRRILDSIRRDPQLAEAVRRALHGEPCDPDSFYRLRSAGVLVGSAAKPQPRCRLFGDYLERRLS